MGKSASETTHELKKYSEQHGGPGTMEDGIYKMKKNFYDKGRSDEQKQTIIIDAILTGIALLVGAAINFVPKIKAKITKPKDAPELSESSEPNPESKIEEPPAPEDKSPEEKPGEDTPASADPE